MIKSICHMVCGLVLVVAGCGVRPPIEGRADPYLPPQVSIADRDLRGRTAVQAPQTDRRNGILYVTVPIRNDSNLDLHVDHKVTFLDRNGVAIYEGPWTGGTTLTRNSYTYLRFNSPTADAADFHVQLRYAQ